MITEDIMRLAIRSLRDGTLIRGTGHVHRIEWWDSRKPRRCSECDCPAAVTVVWWWLSGRAHVCSACDRILCDLALACDKPQTYEDDWFADLLYDRPLKKFYPGVTPLSVPTGSFFPNT